MRIFILSAFLSVAALSLSAQEKWNLKTIVEYAMKNNLGVKQNEIQAKIAALTLKQSKLSQYPSANFTGSAGLNFGSSQDPVSFSRINQTSLNSNLQLQSSADIFNFYSKRNTIAANDWELKAAIANVGKLQNDIALSAANAYLQVLLAMEQEKITKVQVAQTTEQLNTTKKQVEAGTLPELNMVQLEAQLALDSVNYINAKGAVIQNILSLKSFMSIDAATPFEVDVPPIESIPLEPIADLQPEFVFTQALTNQPQQLVNEYRLKAAERSSAAARGAMYPTISAFGGLGSSFLVTKFPNTKQVVGTPVATPAYVTINNLPVFVYSPEISLVRDGYRKTGSVFTQINNNFGQTIGLSLSVPIFNGGSLRTNYEKSKLNINTLQLQKESDNLKLKQDIYSAHNAAMIALEKFNASKKAVSSSQQTYDYANKRFEVGILNTFDLITTQNNLLRAKLEYTINQFDYVFKMKVLEFYKGLGLKL
ncbi:MAG: TolC family protein [Sphingobacteriales bacterium]|nr:MAG: TolC family protein [Sphingobacteriales bacterium]